MKQIVLLPGTPDDVNREYLPEIIKTTDVVVNENGNNSQVYPARLSEHMQNIVDSEPDVWYEYVPETYDPTKKTALVFAMHGGLMTGWGQAIYTSWTQAADRDGFIVVFPNAHSRRLWVVECSMADCNPEEQAKKEGAILLNRYPEKPEDNHDIKFVFELLEHMKQKYNIDEGRVFMQGMSLGNMMTTQFVKYFGNVLAGAAGAGGPSELELLFNADGSLKNRAGHLAIWHSQPELNGMPPAKTYDELTVNKYNRLYWMHINGCKGTPLISILGEDNFAFYQGEKAPLVWMDVKNRDHGQTLDDAMIEWDYYFSGIRREPDGSIMDTGSVLPRKGDAFAVAIAGGAKRAWFNQQLVELSTPVLRWEELKYHGLNGGQKVRGIYLCAPLSFIADVFGAQVQTSDDTLSAVLTLPDGRRLQFARGSIGCVIDQTLRCMKCEALHRDGELLIPFDWFCQTILNLHVSEYDGVLYATDHHAELSMNMAQILRDLMMDTTDIDMLKMRGNRA